MRAPSTASGDLKLREQRYNNGKKAFLFTNGQAGQVYYPDGKVAVVVAQSNTGNGEKYNYYFYDRDVGGTLICSLDENAVGCAMDNGGDPDSSRLVMTKHGGLLSTLEGSILCEWKWDRKAQQCGTLPDLPLRICLNDHLVFTFNGRDDIEVRFSCEGVSRLFQCGRQLRRRESYLSNCEIVRTGAHRGKLIPRMKTKTLQDRQRELVEEYASLRNLNKPASRNIQHSGEVRQVMEKLENAFDPYQERIENGNFATTHLDGIWKQEAFERTMSEVPRISETGHEIGNLPLNADLCGVVPADRLFAEANDGRMSPLGALPDVWPTELEIREKLRKSNPVLRRSFMLRSASGRYSRDLPVHVELQSLRKLPCVTPGTLDQTLNAHPNELVVVVCLREDDQLCVRARQLFEMIESDLQGEGLANNNNQTEDALGLPPTKVYSFAMTHSRYMTNRFGIQTLPAYLVFHRARLVRASIMGSRSVNIVKERSPPRVLIVEPSDFKAQLQMEKLLKRRQIESELAISCKDAIAHLKYRASIKSANAITFYGLVFIDAEIETSQARTIADLARRTAASTPRGAVLFVSLLPAGSVPRQNMDDGILIEASSDDLIGGVCDLATTKPLKSTTLDTLLDKFDQHLRTTRGGDAAEPEENTTHYGFKKADVARMLRVAYQDAQQGNYLPPAFKLGMQLAANRAVFRGVKLERV